MASGWHRKRTNTEAVRRRAAEYASREHRETRRVLMAELKRNGSQRCAEPICLLRRPLLWDDPDGIELAHTVDRSGYRGLAHKTCNASEAAKRAAAKRNRPPGATRVRL